MLNMTNRVVYIEVYYENQIADKSIKIIVGDFVKYAINREPILPTIKIAINCLKVVVEILFCKLFLDNIKRKFNWFQTKHAGFWK